MVAVSRRPCLSTVARRLSAMTVQSVSADPEMGGTLPLEKFGLAVRPLFHKKFHTAHRTGCTVAVNVLDLIGGRYWDRTIVNGSAHRQHGCRRGGGCRITTCCCTLSRPLRRGTLLGGRSQKPISSAPCKSTVFQRDQTRPATVAPAGSNPSGREVSISRSDSLVSQIRVNSPEEKRSGSFLFWMVGGTGIEPVAPAV